MNLNFEEQLKNFQGQFLVETTVLAGKLKSCKALILDWDGVFNDGTKDVEGNSPFSEIDSMGTNLLRFNMYLQQLVSETQNNLGATAPLSFIISGEENKAAIRFARRENFTGIYGGFKDKTLALNHICAETGLVPEDFIFIFDDVLDLNVAKLAGLRILIGNGCNPALQQFVVKNNLTDYITASTGGSGGLREAMEMIITLSGKSDETFQKRMDYSEHYCSYLASRKEGKAHFYISQKGQILEQIEP